MARATVKQRYFVASQEIMDGKTVLVLLEEGKDTATCHNIMKGKEFASKHTQLAKPVRVCILRDEPAYMVQAKPSELAQRIREAAPESADTVLGLMADAGVDVAGEMEVTEVDLEVSVHQPPAQAPQDTPGPAPEPTPEPEAAAAPAAAPEPVQEAPVAAEAPASAPPEVKYLDELRIVPSNYQTLPHEQLLAIAQKIEKTIDGTCTKLACMAVIGKYLETKQRNVGEAEAPPAPPVPEPAPVDYSAVPPAEGFVQEVCTPDQCGAIIWRGPDGKAYDAVEGYPEHVGCPFYVQAQADAQAAANPPTPPPPPGPPPGAEPPPVPTAEVQPPPAVAPSGGFTSGGGPSGQATPPPTPPPPPPPAPQGQNNIGVPPGGPPPPAPQ